MKKTLFKDGDPVSLQSKHVNDTIIFHCIGHSTSHSKGGEINASHNYHTTSPSPR